LYWFRTPPYVKVGRAAIDPDAMARLEHLYPDIRFDWDRLLREPPETLREEEAARRKDQRDARDARRKRKRSVESEALEAGNGPGVADEPLENQDLAAEPDVFIEDAGDGAVADEPAPAADIAQGKRRRRRRRRGRRSGEPGGNPTGGAPPTGSV
jgi:hypothetical protein